MAGTTLFVQMLPMVKPALTEILSMYYHHHSLNNTLQKDVMATIAAAIVTNMTLIIEQVWFIALASEKFWTNDIIPCIWTEV
jgi:hypothetical protein